MYCRSPVGSSLRRKIADLHVDHVAAGVEPGIPDVLEQLRPGEGLAWTAHQIFEQLELRWKQINRPAGATHGPLDQIHFQIAALQPGARVACAAQQSLDPRSQLAHVERLDEELVGAGLEFADSVVHRRRRTDHQNRGIISFAAQGLDDRQAVLPVQHAVHDDNGRPAGTRRAEGVARCLREPDRMAIGLEMEADFLGDVEIVPDQEDGGVDPPACLLRNAQVFVRGSARHAHRA